MSDPIPQFDRGGHLPPGVHSCTVDQFIERFCGGDDARRPFAPAIRDVANFAASRAARRVFVGGSFVTSTPNPNDVDLVIAFSKSTDIPSRVERLVYEGQKTDVMFCSEDQPVSLNAFVHLLGHDRSGRECGVVQISIDPEVDSFVSPGPPDDDVYAIIKETYYNREFFNVSRPMGLLVTVHGLNTAAAWNSTVAPVASSQGWIVAPFIYGVATAELLVARGKRSRILDQFRRWIFDLHEQHCRDGLPVSVIGHSFGTYLIGAYLSGFERPPVRFNTVILAGCILSCDFDWAAVAHSVGYVRNEIAPNDPWVNRMPHPPLSRVMGPIFGRAGVDGFGAEVDFLEQPQNQVFSHGNMLQKDVIAGQWMPLLNSRSYLAQAAL